MKENTSVNNDRADIHSQYSPNLTLDRNLDPFRADGSSG
jgi:hypothetical protein